jgi:hypothetical protein
VSLPGHDGRGDTRTAPQSLEIDSAAIVSTPCLCSLLPNPLRRNSIGSAEAPRSPRWELAVPALLESSGDRTCANVVDMVEIDAGSMQFWARREQLAFHGGAARVHALVAVDVPRQRPWSKERFTMIILGIILAVLGYVLGVSILETVGLILLVIGAVLWILGAVGRPIAGRRVWY